MSILLNIERAVDFLLTDIIRTHSKHHCECATHETHKGHKLTVKVKDLQITASGDIKMAFTLKDSEFTVLHAALVDAVGQAVSGAGLKWTSSDTNILTVAPTSDGLSAVVSTTGQTGQATITVSNDTLQALFDIDVVTGDAVSITVTADAPQSRLPVAPVAEAPAVVEEPAPAPAEDPAPAPVVDAAPAPTAGPVYDASGNLVG